MQQSVIDRSQCCLVLCQPERCCTLGELSEAEEGKTAELKALHPRLDALEAQYGPMAGAVAHRATAISLSSSMLEVHLVCVAPSAGKKMGRQTKKIPGEAFKITDANMTNADISVGSWDASRHCATLY